MGRCEQLNSMRTPAELCSDANKTLHDWRFEPLPDGAVRLRQHPYGGLQPLALVLAAAIAFLAITARNSAVPDGRWFILVVFGSMALMLLAHGASTVEYIAGNNFLEQHGFFCGFRWRTRRLLGASLQGIRLKGDQDRWRMRAVRKGVEVGSLISGWNQFQPVGELLARATGWKIELCLENGTRVEWPSPNRGFTLDHPWSPSEVIDPRVPPDYRLHRDLN